MKDFNIKIYIEDGTYAFISYRLDVPFQIIKEITHVLERHQNIKVEVENGI